MLGNLFNWCHSSMLKHLSRNEMDGLIHFPKNCKFKDRMTKENHLISTFTN